MMRMATQILAVLVAALGAFAVAQGQPGITASGINEFHVTGTVVDANSGSPLAMVTVSLLPVRSGTKPPSPHTTDADGHFQFDHVTAGKYLLAARRRGYRSEKLDEHGDFSTGVAVGPDLVSDGIVFRLRPDSSLSGRISDEANEPVANARVMLFGARNDDPKAMRHLRDAQTDDEGVFRFPHLAPATYIIGVTAQPWYAQQLGLRHAREGPVAFAETAAPSLDMAYPLTFYSETTDEESATRITLSAGARFTADITMRAIPALHLQIHTPRGVESTAAPFVTVIARVFGTEIAVPTRPTILRDREVTEITGIAPGHYELSATMHSGSGQTESRREVDLPANSEIESSQPATGTAVSGTLTFDTPASPGNEWRALIVLNDPANDRRAIATLKPDGSFDFGQSVAPGKYRVALNGGPIYLKSLSATGARVSGRDLTIGAAPVKLALVAGRGLGTIDGVAMREGHPQSGAMVILVPENPAEQPLFRRDQSDSDGTFRLPAIVPGKYTVIAVSGWDFLWNDPETLSQYLSRGQKVEVQPHGKYQMKVEIQ